MRLWWCLALSSSLLLAGCPGKPAPPQGAEGAAKPAEAQPAQSAASEIPVEVATVKLGDIQSTSQATALFEGWRDITISAEVGGTVLHVNVIEGSRVKQGQLLVELDHAQLDAQVASTQAQLDAAKARLEMARTATRPQELAQAEAGLAQAKAALDLAQKNYERQKELYEQGVVSRAVLDAAESQLKQAKAAYEAAAQAVSLAKEGARTEDIKAAEAAVHQLQAALQQVTDQRDKTYIKAPFNGKVTKVLPEEHEMLSPGMPVLGLVDDSLMEVTIGVSGDIVTKLQVGRAVDVRVEALDRTFKGKVRAVGVKGDEVSGAFPVKVTVPNKDGKILSGMAGEVTLPLVSHRNVVVLPRNAVIFQKDKAQVMVNENGVAKAREIKLGLDAGDFVEVAEGLKPGDEVIVVGMKNVFDGTAVKVVKTGEMPSQPSSGQAAE